MKVASSATAAWPDALPRRTLPALAAISALLLLLSAGCASEPASERGTQPASGATTPASEVYLGWRAFQDKCARCHGPDATGTKSGPDLVARMGGMVPPRFVDSVLRRYDWELAAVRRSYGLPAEARTEQILKRQESPMIMPSWREDPGVSAHIMDLYAYLSARASGSQGPGQPAH
ncbi:MAG: hypothetical protein RJA36_772 [Pseudomonadota bacterium]